MPRRSSVGDDNQAVDTARRFRPTIYSGRTAVAKHAAYSRGVVAVVMVHTRFVRRRVPGVGMG